MLLFNLTTLVYIEDCSVLSIPSNDCLNSKFKILVLKRNLAHFNYSISKIHLDCQVFKVFFNSSNEACWFIKGGRAPLYLLSCVKNCVIPKTDKAWFNKRCMVSIMYVHFLLEFIEEINLISNNVGMNVMTHIKK